MNIFYMIVRNFLLIPTIFVFVDAQRTTPSSILPDKSWLLANLTIDSYYSNDDISVSTLLSTNCSRPAGFCPTFNFGLFGNQVKGANFGSYLNILAVYVFVPSPDVVWHANLNPVSSGATLQFTANDGLVLRDESNHLVWSSDTSGRAARSMNLTCQGNLVIYGNKGEILWQSFDHPTDTWLSGQSLSFGTLLRSKVSDENLSNGSYYLSIEEGEVDAYFVDDINHSIEYGFLYSSNFRGMYNPEDEWIFNYFNFHGYKITYNDTMDINITYLRLDYDGRLNMYAYTDSTFNNNLLLRSTLKVDGGECGYPTTCGNYGVCFNNGNECRCPQDDGDKNVNYFKQANDSDFKMGCIPLTDLSCPTGKGDEHVFIELVNVTPFASESTMTEVDIERCKTECHKNCSCKAAIFRYQGDTSSGNCSLLSQVLTLKRLGYQQDWVGDGSYRTTSFIKVQRPTQKKGNVWPILAPSLTSGIFIVSFIVGAVYYVMVVRKKRKDENVSELVMIDKVTRFSFVSIKSATNDFQKKLGRGGYGSVFEGVLEDETKVAVKRLDSAGQGTKEFLAEVNTIGRLHHFNLVKLIGFCDDRSNRLLVYELMPNGSLDKWIFNKDLAKKLTWTMRQRIIIDIAKGLEYLHENCLQKVIHFDIKSQNILLDKKFNVKISDFGLAKMVDRDQSHVMTIIRGTPGYMAPELVTAQVISVKVDVYSFGVLVMEIVCGRKNFGSSEDDSLINLVKTKADEDRLSDLIDECLADMQQHKEAAIKMMKIAIWCLQPHFIRPNMSMVVKILQDLPNMDALTDLSYQTMVFETNTTEIDQTFSTNPIESILSGPR